MFSAYTSIRSGVLHSNAHMLMVVGGWACGYGHDRAYVPEHVSKDAVCEGTPLGDLASGLRALTEFLCAEIY